MTTTTLHQYVVCNNDGQYLSAKSPVWERQFTNDVSEARIYATENNARGTLINYFSEQLDSIAIGEVNRTITTEVIKQPDFTSKESLFDDEITDFAVLNRAYNEDAEAMSDSDYKRWGNLKRILETQDLIERVTNPETRIREWVIK
jgi:hypothetical protein